MSVGKSYDSMPKHMNICERHGEKTPEFYLTRLMLQPLYSSKTVSTLSARQEIELVPESTWTQ